jgi:hypothetical protein
MLRGKIDLGNLKAGGWGLGIATIKKIPEVCSLGPEPFQAESS